MDISNINGISTGDIKSFFNNTSLTKTDKTDSFSDVLSAAMGSIGETNDLQNAAAQEEVRFALGESDNTHDLLVAETKAAVALQYTVAVRDKIIDAYKELIMDWIPRTVRQRQRKIDEAIKNIELRTGKTANDADLAKELSISEDELCSWQSQLKVTNVVSLDEFDESGPEPVMDAAHNSHYAQPEEIVTQEELKTMLVKSLDNLTEKERRVIELYYYEDLTLKEISNILEVSESRVSQLHTKGLIKMRKVMGPYMNILTNA